MFEYKVNKKLLPLKTIYFLLYGCIGPILGFMPTWVKQLGYSVTTYGVVMTLMTIFMTPLLPAVGLIVDKFRVKKFLLVTSMFGMGFMAFLFMYVPKVPSDTSAVQLTCNWKTRKLVVRTENEKTIFTTGNGAGDVLETCMFQECRFAEPYDQDLQSNASRAGSVGRLSSSDQIDVAFKLKDAEYVDGSYVFHLASVRINGTETPSITCSPQDSPTFCRPVRCSSDRAMGVAPRGGGPEVLGLYQFWIFFTVTIVFFVSLTIAAALLNPICLDTLDDKPEDFGKQRLWASIGWGMFSILVGLLVDVRSIGKKEKDYTPVFFSGVVLLIVGQYILTKVQVQETKKSKDKKKSVYKLFTRFCVAVFYVWAVLNSFLNAVISHFLFWYMEELVMTNNDPSQLVWLKTLQGLAQGVQCFGGEIPFFFLSGWIIKRIGYYNCMAVALGAVFLRMFLYTVIWNPAWIVLIELLNGLTYALALAVKMSYGKKIAPPDMLNTVIGLIALLDITGESLGNLLGGYVFGLYGGVWSYRFFATCSALLCFLTLLMSNVFRLEEDLEKSNFIAVTDDSKITVTNDADRGAVVLN